jgi:hypothetical protein
MFRFKKKVENGLGLKMMKKTVDKTKNQGKMKNMKKSLLGTI